MASQFEIYKLAGQEVRIRVSPETVERKGMLMVRRAAGCFKILGRPTVYMFDQVTRVLDNHITIK